MSERTANRTEASPFHRGEQTVQDRLGVRDIEDWARKVVRDYLPEQHRAFHTAQPFLLVSARDEVGRPWATLLNGSDGFVTSPDPRHLLINRRRAMRLNTRLLPVRIWAFSVLNSAHVDATA